MLGPTIGLLDANARLGSVLSVAVSDIRPAQVQDSAGHDFHQMAISASLKVANTFRLASPEGYTFTSNKGTRHRIDYIATSAALFQSITDIRVEADFDNGLATKY